MFLLIPSKMQSVPCSLQWLRGGRLGRSFQPKGTRRGKLSWAIPAFRSPQQGRWDWYVSLMHVTITWLAVPCLSVHEGGPPIDRTSFLASPWTCPYSSCLFLTY